VAVAGAVHALTPGMHVDRRAEGREVQPSTGRSGAPRSCAGTNDDRAGVRPGAERRVVLRGVQVLRAVTCSLHDDDAGRGRRDDGVVVRLHVLDRSAPHLRVGVAPAVGALGLLLEDDHVTGRQRGCGGVDRVGQVVAVLSVAGVRHADRRLVGKARDTDTVVVRHHLAEHRRPVVGAAEGVAGRTVADHRARRAGRREVLVVGVPAVLDVDDPHVAATAAGDRSRVVRVDPAIGGRLAVHLVRFEVGRCLRQRGRQRFGVRDLDDVQRVEIVDQCDLVRRTGEAQAVVQVEVGLLAPRRLLDVRLLCCQCGFRAVEQAVSADTLVATQHVLESGEVVLLGDERATAQPDDAAFDELQVQRLARRTRRHRCMRGLVRCLALLQRGWCGRDGDGLPGQERNNQTGDARRRKKTTHEKTSLDQGADRARSSDCTGRRPAPGSRHRPATARREDERLCPPYPV
jgi:hypothetical protein